MSAASWRETRLATQRAEGRGGTGRVREKAGRNVNWGHVSRGSATSFTSATNVGRMATFHGRERGSPSPAINQMLQERRERMRGQKQLGGRRGQRDVPLLGARGRAIRGQMERRQERREQIKNQRDGLRADSDRGQRTDQRGERGRGNGRGNGNGNDRGGGRGGA